MKLIDDNHCFACGEKNPDGLQLSFETDTPRRSSRTSYVIPKKFAGWSDITHGGIVATILDEAMAYAAFATRTVCVTGEMTIRYKKPVPTETRLEITGRITEQKHRILYATADISLHDEILASCEGKLVKIDGHLKRQE